MSSQHQPPAASPWVNWRRAIGDGAAGRGAGRRAVDLALTVAVYVALVLFGLAQGLLGAFFYASGTPPLAAIGFDAVILATCLLGGWGMRNPAGGLAPAVGWLVVVLVFASGTSGGSVLITATAAGEWFLFGGAVCAAAGVVTSFALWSGSARGRPGRRPDGGPRPGGSAGRRAGA